MLTSDLLTHNLNDLRGKMVATDVDVAIVGLGPVGHVAAALLGRAGHRVAIFDRQLSLYPLPRIGHLDHEVMRIIQALHPGAAEQFEKTAVACGTYDWVNAKGEILIHFDWSKPEITGWQPHYLFYQPDLDAVLAEAICVLPNIEVGRGWEAVGIEQTSGKVSLELRRREGEERRRVTARYVVGADGANGFVRRESGIQWNDLGFRADWLVVDYRPNDPDAEIDIPIAGQLCDPARPVSMFRRIGHKHCRWEFMLMPGETREEMEDAKRIWQLLERWVKPSDGTLVRHAVYTFRSGLATEWKTDSVLLIGDAAHVMPPFLGQGMGSGFRDAMNLSWKLDMVISGRADASLLDTYKDERKQHVQDIIEQAVGLGKVVCISDPDAAAARDAALLAGEAPPPPPFPTIVSGLIFKDLKTLTPHLPAGELAPQGVVERDGVRGRFDDVIGHGWFLLTFDASLAEDVQTRWTELLARLQMRVIVLSESSVAAAGVADHEGVYLRYLDQHSLVALIMRPDFYVFGGGSVPGDVNLLLESLEGIFARTH